MTIKTMKSPGNAALGFHPGSLARSLNLTRLVPCTLNRALFLAGNTPVGCIKATWHGGWLRRGEHGD